MMWTARGREALRKHWPLLAIVALSLAVRSVAWLAIHPAWWILGDSIGYLLDTLHLRPDSWRPSGYSLLILWPLLPAHSLSLITAVQHLMGVGVGVAIYATLLRLSLPPWGAALAATPVLFDGYVIATEQMLAAEPLFSMLIALALVLLLWSLDKPRHVVVVIAGLLLGLSAITRVVGLPLIAGAVLFLLLPRPAWSRLFALCFAFLLPVLVYAAWVSQSYGTFNLTPTNGIFLYGHTAPFVNCSKVSFSDKRLRRLCPVGPPGSHDETYYVFNPGSPVAKTGLSLSETNALAGKFAIDVIRAQPGDFARLAWDGVLKTFAWDQTSLFNDMLFRPGEVLPDEARAVAKEYQGRDPGPFDRPALINLMAAYQRVVSVPGTACLVGLLVALAALLFGRDPARRLRRAVLLTAGAATILLLIPALTTIVAPRYRIPAIPELCLAVAISARLLANRWSGPDQTRVQPTNGTAGRHSPGAREKRITAGLETIHR
jgi:hypothetical protein